MSTSAVFDQSYYLTNNADVVVAISQGHFANALDHYNQFGGKELRAPNATFNPTYYAVNNADVLNAVSSGVFANVFEHYKAFGETENRAPNTNLASFDAAGYLEANADVAAAVTAGDFKSALDHFLTFGQTEGRGGSGVTAVANPGQTFLLTTGIDALVGTANGDTFQAVDAANVGAGDTLQLADTIDGGDGNDTLIITSDQEGAVASVNLTSIENISIRTSDDDDNTGSSFNASSAGGLTNLTLDRITDDFTVTGLSTAVKTKIFDNSTGEDVSITYASVTGSADTATIEVDKLGTTNLVIGDGIETVSLSSSGTKSTIAQLDHGANATTLNVDAGVNLTISESDQGADNTVKTINISGAGKTTIGGELSTATTTLDASGSTGGFSATLNNVAAKATVTGGAGGDTLTAINANANTISLGAGDDSVDLNAVVAANKATIAGGDGNDTLVFGDASATLITANNKAAFSGFEVMKSEVSTDTLNFEALSTFTGFAMGAATALTVNNLSTAAAASVTVSGVQTTSAAINIKNATQVGSQDTLGLTLDHATANTRVQIADLQIDGVETLNLVSTGAGTNTNTVEIGTESNDIVNINISGDSRITITDEGDISGQQIVTSTATGNVTVTFDADTEGTAVTTAGGNDNITTNSGADAITTGDGTDTVNAGLGIDNITFGDGAKTLNITFTTAQAVTANRKIVTGFDAETDSLDLNGTAFSALGAGGNDNITAGGAAANEFTSQTTAGSITVADPVAVIEFAFEFSSGVDLDSGAANSLSGVNLLSALGAATGTTAGTITTAGNDEDLVLIAYQDGDALIYHGNGAGTNTALVGSEISLIAILQGVGVGDLSVADII